MKYGLTATCYGFFNTLANPTRLAILETLKNGPMNVTAITETLGLEQSMVSHNLKQLEECALVFIERRGKEKIVSLNKDTMEPIFTAVERHALNHCPHGGSCAKSK